MTPHRALPPFDASAVLALIRNAFAGMQGRINPPSSIDRLTVDDIARQATEAEIWVIGSPPLACLFLTPEPGALYLHKLAVAPEAQRRGHARKLLAVAESRARALGLPALRLMTRVELVENHATFRALGFTETGATSHPGHARPTSLGFSKSLT